MKFDVIVSDPPWSFDDRLTMDDVKRGAAANYSVLDGYAIQNLNVKDIAADDAVLALWVPSSLMSLGLKVMNNWGFRQTQSLIWVKQKKDPLAELKKAIRKKSKKKLVSLADINQCIDEFDLNSTTGFFMGRLFRQCHEVVLIGAKGKCYSQLRNKSQRSVLFDINHKHSAKPEILQDRLELMFPAAKQLEMFARRDRAKWTCVGFECPSSLGEDIRDSISRLIKL